MDKEGGFVNRPPLLDGSNYDNWKSGMSAVLKGWDNPLTLDAVGNRTDVLKAEEKWTSAEDELTLGI